MKIYADLDSNGYPQAFYLDVFYGPYSTDNTEYPQGVVEITEQQWITLLNNPGMAHIVDNQVKIET